MTDKTLAPCGSDSSKELGRSTCEQGCNGCDDCTDFDEADDWCDVPPLGWRCTRARGHEGPCAAVECPEDIDFVQRGMDRLRDQPNAELGDLRITETRIEYALNMLFEDPSDDEAAAFYAGVRFAESELRSLQPNNQIGG